MWTQSGVRCLLRVLLSKGEMDTGQVKQQTLPTKARGREERGGQRSQLRLGKDENRSSGLAVMSQADLGKSHVSKWW